MSIEHNQIQKQQTVSPGKLVDILKRRAKTLRAQCEIIEEMNHGELLKAIGRKYGYVDNNGNDHIDLCVVTSLFDDMKELREELDKLETLFT
jgi:hypothetical protein